MNFYEQLYNISGNYDEEAAKKVAENQPKPVKSTKKELTEEQRVEKEKLAEMTNEEKKKYLREKKKERKREAVEKEKQASKFF